MSSSNAITEPKVSDKTYPSPLRVWLFIGVIMIFFQVVLGGITRLTGSGLSITKWEIVTGTLPPIGEDAWQTEFELYKRTPQYSKINAGMTLSEFKFIYFWEYIHRLWARAMGFVFLIPFLVFYFKGWIDKWLLKRLGIVVLLAALVASLGWIMVASGLIDRPWVNAYKLTLHLSLAIITFAYLFWITLQVSEIRKKVFHNPVLKNWSLALLVIVSVQIVLGGLMSGMKAALSYPTWPMMHGNFIPEILWEPSNWRWQHFTDYDQNAFMPALVQVLHRLIAYSLIIIGLWFMIKKVFTTTNHYFRKISYLWLGFLLVQALLGILTLINSQGIIPLWLGVFHQAGGLILLTITLILTYLPGKESTS